MALSDIAELEARLRAHPEDGESWRVYADWLLDQGDKHGQIIQLDHELATPSLSEARRGALLRERAELVRSQGWESDGTLRLKNGRLEWLHGYVWSATLGDGIVLEALRDLLRQPHKQFLCGLTVSGLSAPEALGLGQLLPRTPVERLTVRGACPTSRLRKVLGGADKIRQLQLDHLGGGDEVVQALSEAPLPALRELVLSQIALTAKGTSALARSPWLASLQRLALRNARLDASLVEPLAHEPALRGLCALDLSYNALGDRGLVLLAQGSELQSLSSLELASNGIGLEGLQALADSRVLRSLRTLDLSHNQLYDDEIALLASSEALQGLTRLGLADTPLADWGVEALARSETLRSLTELDLRHVEASVEAIEELADARPEVRVIFSGEATEPQDEPQDELYDEPYDEEFE